MELQNGLLMYNGEIHVALFRRIHAKTTGTFLKHPLKPFKILKEFILIVKFFSLYLFLKDCLSIRYIIYRILTIPSVIKMLQHAIFRRL